MGAREGFRAAVGQPVGGADVHASVCSHAAVVRAAGADVVVFPEMSLTGYRLDAAPIEIGCYQDLLGPLVEACASVNSCALVGAPVIEEARLSIATVRVDGSGAEVVYRKTYLTDEESSRFASGPGAECIEIGGWRIGLGICKDTGVSAHIEATAALNIDVYVAGVVHHRSELEEQLRRATEISSRCDAYVAMASYAGPTGGGYRDTAGNSLIVSPAGTVLAQAGDLAGDFVTTVLV